MLILHLCEVGKKTPVHNYNISNIVKQQSFQENIEIQNCTYLGAFTLQCQNLSHTLKESDKCFRMIL